MRTFRMLGLSLVLGTGVEMLTAQELLPQNQTPQPFAPLPGDVLPDGAPAAPRILGEEEFGRQATWANPALPETRSKILDLAKQRKLNEVTVKKLEALWPAGEASLDPSAVLDRFGRSIVLLEPATTDLVKLASQHRGEYLLPEFPVLRDEAQPEFLRHNLRLYYGRWLSQERYYEESFDVLRDLAPTQVVDPGSLLFFQSVNYHALLFKKEGLETLTKLFERRTEIPRRYELVGRMMQMDLAALKEDSLDHISRRMNDITRRLEFGRSGKKVQGEEKKVIAALDKLIEELEKEKSGGGGAGAGGGGGGQGQGGGDPQGIQSSGPAQESKVARGKGDGNINKKNIGNKAGWGDLPPKEREEALQQIGKEFPSHYRDLIEEFFRRQAEAE